MLTIHSRILVCVRRLNRETPKITIQRSFMAARVRCGIPGIRFHDLRHSAASELINAGVDLYTVGRVLGHKDPRSTQRYSHLAIDTLTVAVSKIGKKSP
ncbi:tyrosine-type recombinase/integrase [Glaciimonas sp. GG7]